MIIKMMRVTVAKMDGVAMPGPAWFTSQLIEFSQQPCGVNTVINPILERRRLRPILSDVTYMQNLKKPNS